MSDPFLAEIRMFAGDFAPKGWALCNGQIIAIAQNTALFSLLGTNFGGNGTSTFALPDLRGRAPMHWGNGAGLTPRSLGESGGEESVTLLSSELASHTHTLGAAPVPAGTSSPSPANGTALARTSNALYVNPASNPVAMSPLGTGQSGGGQPHNNEQPYTALSFIIALVGIFPQRP